MLLSAAGTLVTTHMENSQIICGFTPISLVEDYSQGQVLQ